MHQLFPCLCNECVAVASVVLSHRKSVTTESFSWGRKGGIVMGCQNSAHLFGVVGIRKGVNPGDLNFQWGGLSGPRLIPFGPVLGVTGRERKWWKTTKSRGLFDSLFPPFTPPCPQRPPLLVLSAPDSTYSQSLLPPFPPFSPVPSLNLSFGVALHHRADVSESQLSSLPVSQVSSFFGLIPFTVPTLLFWGPSGSRLHRIGGGG